jgi:ATP:ADP antiporter, AAA family
MNNMIRAQLVNFKREFSEFSAQERFFILFAMLCGFFISSEYAIVRPVSNAVFLTAYGATAFPYAWLATVPLNLIVVSFYNKYLPRLGCFRMFATIAGLVIATNLFCSLFLKQISWLPFVFYLWKEIYIMLMLQQLWSVIHSKITYGRAKYIYGLFFGVGALGASIGSILPGFFAVKMGSESLLVATLPIYLLLVCCYYFALQQTKDGVGMKLDDERQRTSLNAFFHGLKMIRSSNYLTFILGIVVLMQLCSTLIDFQFNTVLEKTIQQKDLRTEYTARILGIVHAVTISLQLFGSFLLIHFLGIKRSHLLIPSLLCLNSIAFQFFPIFGVISFAYISIKSCDFSLFAIIKEILYIPLKQDEKFRAKAVIDVFAYRSSKAIASAIILGLQAILGAAFLPILNWGSILFFVLWIGIVIALLKEPEHSPETKIAPESDF